MSSSAGTDRSPCAIHRKRTADTKLLGQCQLDGPIRWPRFRSAERQRSEYPEVRHHWHDLTADPRSRAGRTWRSSAASAQAGGDSSTRQACNSGRPLRKTRVTPRDAVGDGGDTNDFYVTILEEARAAHFGTVRLRRDSAGWRRMLATDAAVAQCTTGPSAPDPLERVSHQTLAPLENILPEEIDQPFVFYTWHPDAPSLQHVSPRRDFAAVEHRRTRTADRVRRGPDFSRDRTAG